MTREDVLLIYDQAVAQCPDFERKGKTMPYTSANGHMFSQLNKEGQLGIRFSKEVQKSYMEALETGYFYSYGATMKGYICVPESVLSDISQVSSYLKESYAYVMSLEPK